LTNTTSPIESDTWKVSFTSEEPTAATMYLSGCWCAIENLPSVDAVLKKILSHAATKHISFDVKNVTKWDAGLLSFITKLQKIAKKQSIGVNTESLDKNMRSLLVLANAVPKKEIKKKKEKKNIFYRVGHSVVEFDNESSMMVAFIGAVTKSFVKLFRGKAQFLWGDLFYFIQDCSINALPIVLIITFLMGLILAFIGAVQLNSFGAGIYVANLVAVGMTREMSPLMIAIIMSGRTGAAYAAQIGSMQVNEEVDALRTTVISPIDFLVIPRILALVIIMPFLCLYGDLLGIFAGMLIGIKISSISTLSYFHQTLSAITVGDIAVGVVKSFFFSFLVAMAGCYQGLRCGRNSDAVGNATTKAVVNGILYVIAADAIFEIILYTLKI